MKKIVSIFRLVANAVCCLYLIAAGYELTRNIPSDSIMNDSYMIFAVGVAIGFVSTLSLYFSARELYNNYTVIGEST